MGTAGNGAPKPKISGPKPYNAAASKSQPFWANWGAGLNQQSKQIGDGAGKWWADVTKNSKNWKAPKWEMPVHVDVDVLNPIILSVKRGAKDVWIRLPLPVQQGLPYVAVGATTGMLVWKIQGGRLNKERKMTDKLQTRVETLMEEREKLQDRVKNLNNRASAPKSASEMKMAAAVAEATNAAAAAATAAASAASRCSVVVRRGPQEKET